MLHKNVILTPHLGEMARFENKTIDEIKDNLVKVLSILIICTMQMEF